MQGQFYVSKDALQIDFLVSQYTWLTLCIIRGFAKRIYKSHIIEVYFCVTEGSLQNLFFLFTKHTGLSLLKQKGFPKVTFESQISQG